MGNISKKQRAAEEAIRLRLESKSVEEIAEATGLSEMEVVDTLAAEGNSLVALQNIKKEATIVRTGNTREQRLSRLSSLRDSLQKEIESRGLSEVPAEKLIALYLKVEEAVERNTAAPTIASSLERPLWEDQEKETITL